MEISRVLWQRGSESVTAVSTLRSQSVFLPTGKCCHCSFLTTLNKSSERWNRATAVVSRQGRESADLTKGDRRRPQSVGKLWAKCHFPGRAGNGAQGGRACATGRGEHARQGWGAHAPGNSLQAGGQHCTARRTAGGKQRAGFRPWENSAGQQH